MTGDDHHNALTPAETEIFGHFFFFGYGYTADMLRIALQQVPGQKWTFAGTTRDEEKREYMNNNGVRPFYFDYQRPLADPEYVLSNVTHLLISTPPGDDGDPTFNMHGLDIAMMKNLKWVGYLSTTAVYGDRNGGWVDENSEIRPSTKRGSRRARAEQQWLSLLPQNVPVHIFRLAGIYGPGRSAIDTVRAGTARRIYKPGHAFSRIHVADIVQTLMASMARPNPGAAYNLADDSASPSHEVIAYACQLLGINPPPLIPYEEADMAPIARSFYADNKRIKNDRIKNELGVQLQYPDYMSGLQSCL